MAAFRRLASGKGCDRFRLGHVLLVARNHDTSDAYLAGLTTSVLTAGYGLGESRVRHIIKAMRALIFLQAERAMPSGLPPLAPAIEQATGIWPTQQTAMPT